jgi:hypothetical protein
MHKEGRASMGMEYSSRIDFPHAAEAPPIGEGNQEESGLFTRCGHCGKVWSVRDEFVNDPEVFLAGKRANTMRAFIASVTQGLLVFVHNVGGCGSRLLVAPEALVDRPNN